MNSLNSRKEIALSIVVPIWNEVIAIGIYTEKIIPILNGMKIDYEIIFCVDPSSDGTEIEIQRLSKSHPNLRAIFFSNRTGQAASTFFGLLHAAGKAVIVMDVDLQDPVELIPDLFQLWQEGNKLVIPIRSSRSGEPFTKKMTANIGYWFLSRFADIPIPKNAGDFRLMDKQVVGRLKSLNEYHLFLRGMVSFVGEPAKYVYFSRPKRVAGETKYNKWIGGIKSSLDGILSYTSFPLEFLALLNFIISAVSCAFSIGIVLFSNFSLLVISVIFLQGLAFSALLLTLGILSLYLARIHIEVKKRPRWIVRDSLNMRISRIDRFDNSRTGM